LRNSRFIAFFISQAINSEKTPISGTCRIYGDVERSVYEYKCGKLKAERGLVWSMTHALI